MGDARGADSGSIAAAQARGVADPCLRQVPEQQRQHRWRRGSEAMSRLGEADAVVNACGDRRRRRHRLATVLATLSVAAAWFVIPSAQVRRPGSRPSAPRAARHAPLKAIFEPVSYPDDADISDVFFVDADTGWASGHRQTGAGDRGFISGTRDGGKTWAAQYGDHGPITDAVARLFFLDARHGWATQVDG